MPIRKPIHKRRPRVRGCFVCHEKLENVDYKDAAFLRQFLSSYGKIMQRRRSRMCAAHQRDTAMAIKRARFLALIPYIVR